MPPGNSQYKSKSRIGGPRLALIDFSETLDYSCIMSPAPVIRSLQSRGEQELFTRIAKYCFADPIGWSDRIFPLPRGDRAWGAFRGRTLESGLITRAFETRVFGAWLPLSGISLVETPPEFRNNRNISALFERVLREELKSGRVCSALFPFSFEYYGKYGYGFIGGPHFTSFAPENISLEKPANGVFAPFDGTRKTLHDYCAVYEAWTEQYTFGIKPRPCSLAEFGRELAWSKDHIVLFYEGNTCTGLVRLNNKIFDNAPSDLTVKQIAWRDERALRALLYLLKTHRNQIKEVKCTLPVNLPVWLFMQNPRIGIWKGHDWMARPLDLESLCRLKAKQRPPQNEIVFSVEDGLLPVNTGCYRIKGEEVKKEKFRPETALPLPLFASLFFGGCSLEDARAAGRLPPALLAGAESFFARDPDIFMTEHF
jgi:predicted acetyltransferase